MPRTKGALNKPKPINLPPWDDNVSLYHRHGFQAVRHKQQQIYQMRLAGLTIDEIAITVSVSPCQVRAVIRRLASRLIQLR
jgi:hypothetical protein